MKITIDLDDGTREEFLHITDLYIAVRCEHAAIDEANVKMAYFPETRSYSWCNNIREMVKELRQSIFDLQHLLDDQREISKPKG